MAARRRPGQSVITTSRNEADEVEVLSGVMEGISLGTPLVLSSETQTNILPTIPTLPNASARRMPISPINQNTESAIFAVVAALRQGKRRREWWQAHLPCKRSSN